MDNGDGSRGVSPWPPNGWRVRQLADPGVSSIRGWDSQAGVGATLGAGALLLSFLMDWGVLMALGSVVACALVGLGWGYHLRVTPKGISYQRTWYGLPLRQRHVPLHIHVTDWWALEQDEPEGVVLEGEHPITLSASPQTTAELVRAIQEAIQRAQRARPSPA